MVASLLKALRERAVLYMLAGLALAGGAGFLSATAFGVGSVEPARTVTVNVATGPTGATGPAGPRGEQGPAGPGGMTCPSGYEAGKLVINHPGGQTAIWTCLA